MKRFATMVAVSLAALSALPLMAVQGTISTENDTKKGDIKWQPRSKSYALSYKKGKTDVSAEFPLADVTALDIPTPPGYEKAVALVERGQGASAVATLQKIVSEYRMLVWDKPAGRYLALAYIAAGQAQKALDMCQSIIAEDPKAAWSGDLAFAYWQALFRLGKTDKLEAALRKAASSGSRQASAAALIMRGDMAVQAGSESPEALRTGLRDGYLRVWLMYGDQECVNERREAGVKAAQCFDKLGQAARAEKLRSQAKGL